MKIIQAKEMARIEQLAYTQGASEETFMNTAGAGVAELIQRCIAEYHLKPKIFLLCGRGNNAGDAYAAGAILHDGGFDVHALALAPKEESSPLCQLQSERYVKRGGTITYVKNADEISFGEAALLVDGILGTGFHGNVEGIFFSAIERANASSLPIVAIDIPSGIDGNTGEVGTTAISATETLFLGLPKTGCFLGEVWNRIGRVRVFDFGLGEEFIEKAKEDFSLIDTSYIRKFVPRIRRTQHKYQAGYVVGLAGSPGMPGAALLSSFATLRSGAGIVRLLHPRGMEAELSGAPYEIIREGYKEEDAKKILEEMARARAVFIGPGLGTSPGALKMLKKVLPKIEKPCVIDAEALTLLAEHPISLPRETILTPHHGEMKRLLRRSEELSMKNFLKACQEFVETRSVTLVLKGAPTFVLHPHRVPAVCAHGDPGMATAGSGDVLTGVIAAFLAQGKSPLEAAELGVYFHSVAGEYAAKKMTSHCMIASDITEALPAVFAGIPETNL